MLDYPSSTNRVLTELQMLNGGSQFDFLITTHLHLDSCGINWSYLEAMPSALVLVNEHGLTFVDPYKLVMKAGT